MNTLVNIMTKTARNPDRRVRRVSRRGDTRQDLLSGALKLLDEDKSLDSLSLRELTRHVGIVPTAFYRHFPGMDELGLALVEESFRVMRKIFADVRNDTGSTDRIIAGVVKSLVTHARKNRLHFRFVASERYGGNPGVREAIRNGMRLLQGELALELARFPYLKEWTANDLQMLAALLVNSMTMIAEEILEQRGLDKYAERELMEVAEKQLRLIVLGIPHWRSGATG